VFKAISPLLRSDFAQSTAGRTPHGDLTDSFVPSDGSAVSPKRAVGHRDRSSELGKVPTMQTNSSIEPPDLGNPLGGGNRETVPFARLLSVVRGDKYMVNAYEPAWSALMERRVGARPIGAGHAAPAASTPKER
jgi:hypothetical protein